MFLNDMVKKESRTPTALTTDSVHGFIRTVGELFLQNSRVRSWYYNMQNLSNKVHADEWQDIKQEVLAIKCALNWEGGKKLAETFCEKYHSLVRFLKDDFEVSLNHLRLPMMHRKSLKIANLVEMNSEE